MQLMEGFSSSTLICIIVFIIIVRREQVSGNSAVRLIHTGSRAKHDQCYQMFLPGSLGKHISTKEDFKIFFF